jgi:phosphocarrier protein
VTGAAGGPVGGMVDRRVTVRTHEGLRAWPAALFVQAATRAPVRVVIAKGGQGPVSARSILAVLGLDVRAGDEVVLSAAGDGAAPVLDQLAALLAGEPPVPDG